MKLGYIVPLTDECVNLPGRIKNSLDLTTDTEYWKMGTDNTGVVKSAIATLHGHFCYTERLLALMDDPKTLWRSIFVSKVSFSLQLALLHTDDVNIFLSHHRNVFCK